MLLLQLHTVNLGEKMENSNYILRTGLNHREACLFHWVLKYMDCVCRSTSKLNISDELVGWHHQLNGHESEQAPGVGDGHESLACCSPWGRKKSDTTEWLNWTEAKGKGGKAEAIWSGLMKPFPTCIHSKTQRRDEGRWGGRWVGGAWWLSGSGWPPPSKDACGSGAWEWFAALLQN